MTRWWLVDDELLLVVLASVLLGATLHAIGQRLPLLATPRVAMTAVLVLVVAHGVQTTRYYWDGRKQTHDWNLSWNEFSYDAAQWLRTHVPVDTRVGSWNAGVLGYFAAQPVVNLDGLINGFDFLPYLRDKRLHHYI